MAEAEPAHRSCYFCLYSGYSKPPGQIPLARTLNEECAERVTPIQFSSRPVADFIPGHFLPGLGPHARTISLFVQWSFTALHATLT